MRQAAATTVIVRDIGSSSPRASRNTPCPAVIPSETSNSIPRPGPSFFFTDQPPYPFPYLGLVPGKPERQPEGAATSRSGALPLGLIGPPEPAARVGFEPTEPLSSAAFKAAALVHYATSPGQLSLPVGGTSTKTGADAEARRSPSRIWCLPQRPRVGCPADSTSVGLAYRLISTGRAHQRIRR